jgi:hypothetical protein
MFGEIMACLVLVNYWWKYDQGRNIHWNKKRKLWQVGMHWMYYQVSSIVYVQMIKEGQEKNYLQNP